VEQDLPAEDQVHLGQRVAGDVGVQEPPPAAGVLGAEPGDQLRHHVDTDVAPHGQLDCPHPVEVAASRVQHRPDA